MLVHLGYIHCTLNTYTVSPPLQTTLCPLPAGLRPASLVAPAAAAAAVKQAAPAAAAAAAVKQAAGPDQETETETGEVAEVVAYSGHEEVKS